MSLFYCCGGSDNNSWHFISRTKKRRTWMVWGREGKPASLKMWVVLTGKRLIWWACGYCLSGVSIQNGLINPARQSARGKHFIQCFSYYSHRRRYPRPVVMTGRPSHLSCRRERWILPPWGITTKLRSWPPSCLPNLRRTPQHSTQDLKDRYGGSCIVQRVFCSLAVVLLQWLCWWTCRFLAAWPWPLVSWRMSCRPLY